MVPMKNLPGLLNLSYYGFNRGLDGDFKPANGVTYCNQFIQYVCNGLGYTEFTGMNANEMVAFMSMATSGWLAVSEEVAQHHANSGVLVIAGWANPDGHGHVCLIVPGVLEKSTSFGKPVPKCVNVGAEVFYGKRVSFAFGTDKTPTYFVLAGMI